MTLPPGPEQGERGCQGLFQAEAASLPWAEVPLEASVTAWSGPQGWRQWRSWDCTLKVMGSGPWWILSRSGVTQGNFTLKKRFFFEFFLFKLFYIEE